MDLTTPHEKPFAVDYRERRDQISKLHETSQRIDCSKLTYQAVMIPLNHIIESIVMDWPLLRKSSGTC